MIESENPQDRSDQELPDGKPRAPGTKRKLAALVKKGSSWHLMTAAGSTRGHPFLPPPEVLIRHILELMSAIQTLAHGFTVSVARQPTKNPEWSEQQKPATGVLVAEIRSGLDRHEMNVRRPTGGTTNRRIRSFADGFGFNRFFFGIKGEIIEILTTIVTGRVLFPVFFPAIRTALHENPPHVMTMTQLYPNHSDFKSPFPIVRVYVLNSETFHAIIFLMEVFHMNNIKTLLILIFLIILLSETPVHANSDDNLQTYEDSVMVNELDAFYNVVIMIRFSDEADYQPPYSYEQYDHFFNATDDISLKDYYLEVSYGQLEITSLVLEEEGELVFYTDLNERSYYQPHSSENPDGYANQSERASREHALIKRAVEYVNDSGLIDPSIDLDINDDGMIDSLTFLVSGTADGWNELLWAHRWELYTMTGKNAPKINGVRAFDYIFSLLDYYDSPSRPMHVGVIAHEMFHLLSAPDLYHYYADRWIRTAGPWDIMETTNRTPSHMLGYMRETYGNWIDAVDEITESGTYTLEPIMNGADHLYRIDTGYSNEYVYLEYRVNTGRYESLLPNSGLIVYRVDFDYLGEGNVDGYYNEFNEAVDEVFVFRPELDNDTFPLYLENYNAGDVYQAALSQFNPYQAIGVGTSIPMFHSDGSQIELRIDNIVELPDGQIRFDVDFNPLSNSETFSIDLVSDLSFHPDTELILIDHPNLSYEVVFSGVEEETTVYYTLDGSTPTVESDIYQGESIEIDADHHTVKAAIMEDGELFMIEKSFTFQDTIETAHNPYGNNQNISWFISFAERTEFQVHFDMESRFESGSDFLYINDGNRTTFFSSTSLRGMVIAYENKDLVLNFQSDETNDDYFGFAAEIVIDDGPPELELIGEQSLEIDVFDVFDDPGTSISRGEDMDLTVEAETNLDIGTIGTYRITYFLILDGETVHSVERTIDVVDREAPEVFLKPGIDTIGIDALHVDHGIEAIDNYDSSVTIDVDGTVDTTTAGNHVITYTATDSSGNSRTIRRVIHVIEDRDPSFRCDVVLTTYLAGQTYTIPTCTFNGREVTADTTQVDHDRPGTYPITYRVEHMGTTHEHVTYVFFYDVKDIDVAHMPFDRRTQ